MWSVGTIFYEMLFGVPPYSAGNIPELIAKVKQSVKYPSGYCSDNAIELLKQLLEVDPKKRLDLNQLYNHPYIQSSLREIEEEDKFVLVNFEDYIPTSSLHVQEIKLTTSETGFIDYPSIIFDHSHLKCRDDEKEVRVLLTIKFTI